MNHHRADINDLKIKIMAMLFCGMILLLSGCASTGDKIKTEEDLFAYLSAAYEQNSFVVKDSVTQGNYKLIAFKDTTGEIGYAFLEKKKDETYQMINTSLTADGSHSVFLYNGDEKTQLLCVVNDGEAKKVIMSVDGKQQESFDLDKDKASPAAYLFPIDYPNAESFGFDFQNGNGESVE